MAHSDLSRVPGFYVSIRLPIADELLGTDMLDAARAAYLVEGHLLERLGPSGDHARHNEVLWLRSGDHFGFTLNTWRRTAPAVWCQLERSTSGWCLVGGWTSKSGASAGNRVRSSIRWFIRAFVIVWAGISIGYPIARGLGPASVLERIAAATIVIAISEPIIRNLRPPTKEDEARLLGIVRDALATDADHAGRPEQDAYPETPSSRPPTTF